MTTGFTGHVVKTGFSAAVSFNDSGEWQILREGHLDLADWQLAHYSVSVPATKNLQTESQSMRLSFVCVTSETQGSNFCGVDSVRVRIA